MQSMTKAATSARHVEKQGSKRRTPWARAALGASGAWVLAVSSVKLFKGSPSDLPLMVQNFIGDMDVGLKFQLVVGIELSVAFLAFLRPRWAWPLLVGMFSLFVAMLGKMILDGETSCGCFGGAIKIQPATMLAVDGACLAAMLFTRPWSCLPATPVRWPLLVVALGAAWTLPFVAFKNEQLPTPPSTAGQGTPTDPGQGPGSVQGEPQGGAPVAAAWKLPDKLPQFQTINPAKQGWLGKHLRDTPMGALLDVELYPLDATWILYRITCEHCAKEFQEIAVDPERSAKLYVVVRIPEPDEEKFRQVNVYPPIYQEAVLPPLPRGYFGQTPWMLEVEAGVVKQVTAGEGVEQAQK